MQTDEDLEKLIFNIREKLLESLTTVEDNSIVLKGKRKVIEKGFRIDQGDFRGSRYRGVSKNKGKWQVCS